MLNFKIEGTLTNENELQMNVSHNIQDSNSPTLDMTMAITHAISELCARSYDENNYEGYIYFMTLIAMTLGSVADKRVNGKVSREQVKYALKQAEQDAQLLSDNL